MFKKPKISKQHKFSGLDNEIESSKPENINQNNIINKRLDFEKSEQKLIKTRKNLLNSNEEDSDKISNLKSELIKNNLFADKNKQNISIQEIEQNSNNFLGELNLELNKEEKNCSIKNNDPYNINLDLYENQYTDSNFFSITNTNINNTHMEENNDIGDYSETIKKIKAQIDKKSCKPKRRGTLIKPWEKVLTTFHKTEENSDPGIKKIFISENDLKNTKNPEELKKLVGVKKEEIDKEKKNKLQKILDHQKDLFTLPQDLQVTPQTKNDYVDNLIKLSAAGLIEVPLSLENKLKNIEETEIMKKQIIDKKLAEELDYLKVLKKLGPSYAKGYKNDLSRKKLTKLDKVFENVFVNFNGRKRKLLKEKMILDNRMLEEGFIRKEIDKNDKNDIDKKDNENESSNDEGKLINK